MSPTLLLLIFDITYPLLLTLYSDYKKHGKKLVIPNHCVELEKKYFVKILTTSLFTKMIKLEIAKRLTIKSNIWFLTLSIVSNARIVSSVCG